MVKITDFSIDLDEETKKQFDDCCSFNFVKSASLMPDAHKGYVAPIGSVFRTIGKVVPAWVGYDIGCGMIACKFSFPNIVNLVRENSDEIFDLVNLKIPMGKGKIGAHGDVSDIISRGFGVSLLNFSKREYNDDIFKFIKTQAKAHLGSLGSGNHFIEISYDSTNESDKDTLWLVIHSGSRGVGHKIATHYMKSASNSDVDFEETHSLDVTSKEGIEYLSVLNFGLEFALLNRLEMAYRVCDSLKSVLNIDSLNFEMWVNKNHNHCVPEANYFVHRKGATPAKLNERGVIPANMRDGCFLVRGLGNEKYLQSSSHGAGRKLSRGQAKDSVSLEDFEKSMEGIKAPVDSDRIDESPFAYKNIYDVMEAQKESVEIVSHLSPIINWKG
jgi:tRNA-splicing ligase RtcB